MPSPTQLAWLDSLVPAAQASQTAFGVPSSVTLAQCILESGWGQTQLAKECNNFFGVKAHTLTDPSTYEEFPTAEYENGQRVVVDAKFEKYPDVEASFRDHARLIGATPRYAPAMEAKDDAYAFANALQACGYSTSPTYGSSLGNLIRQLNLTRYDGGAA
jgi:flagellum-specific peptidoglycan hydrolase FlgJ